MNTTLNEIREYKVCRLNWDKLLKSLNKTEPDDESLSFKHILETIGIKDAVWCLRVLPYIDICLFRADVAESVLHIFENEYPNDRRPGLAIKAVRDFHSGKITEAELESFSEDAYASSFVTTIYAAYAASLASAHATNDTANAVNAANAANAANATTYTAVGDTQWKVIEELFIKHFV